MLNYSRGIYEQSKKNNLGMFSQRVEEAINSRFILADRHISGLLKCVATIPELTAVVGETLKNVSYADEYDKARVVLTKNGKSVCKFVMPNDKKEDNRFHGMSFDGI